MRLAGSIRSALLAGGMAVAGASLPALAAESETTATNRDAYKQLPLKRDADDGGGAGWTVLAFLAALGAVAFIVSARARKGGRAWPLAGLGTFKGAGQRVEVIERRSLNPGCTVCLVRWDDEELLLGCTTQSVSVIARRPAAATEQAQG